MPGKTTTDEDRDIRLHETLAQLARKLERIELEREKLYALRLKAWHGAVDHGWTQARISAASRVSESAVTMGLQRARRSDQ